MRYLLLLPLLAFAKPTQPERRDSFQPAGLHSKANKGKKKKKSRENERISRDAYLSAEGHFKLFEEALQAKNTKEVILQAEIIETNFKVHPLYKSKRYDVAAAYYSLDFLVEANRALSDYLASGLPEHFQEALSMKFEIAQKFGKGEKGQYSYLKSLFTERSFPERAIEIYNDILLYAPSSDLAAYALFHRAQIEMTLHEHDESIETFRTLIHDFIGHEILPQAYFGIAQNYYARYEADRSKTPDLLDLAGVNLENFESAYPSHDLLAQSRELFVDMRSALAWELYQVGRYFERRRKPKAAALYYRQICEKYPDTPAAERCYTHHAKVLDL